MTRIGREGGARKTAVRHLSLDITNHIGYMPRRFLTEATRNRKARVDTLSFPASNGNAAGADAQRGGGHTPRIADAVSARRGRPDEAALRSPSQPPAGNGRGTSGEGTREPHLMARRVSAARQAGFARALSRLSAGRRKCLPPGQSAGPSRDAADGRTRPLAGDLAPNAKRPTTARPSARLLTPRRPRGFVSLGVVSGSAAG
jgi:hypothetical protein